jgi:hypothetical protein
MVTRPWRYAIQVFLDDGTPVDQLPVTVDWDPVQEWLRLTALRRGVVPAEALALECRIEPIWDPIRREPYLAGVRAFWNDTAREALSVTIPGEYFQPVAQLAAARLAARGRLEAGAHLHYLAMAFGYDGGQPAVPAAQRFKTRCGSPTISLGAGCLQEFMTRTAATLGTPVETGDDVPVFLPEDVLRETSALARAVDATETGGILIGHVHRDTATGDLFVEVTAQVPARHVEASLIHLTFTSATWTEVRSAIDLRRRGEIMVGYWHSHPVRTWCGSCSEAEQRSCPYRADFYSPEDRHLHRAVFPRAYCIGLVVNDVAYADPSFSMFGWRHGLIAARPFLALASAPRAMEVTSAC